MTKILPNLVYVDDDLENLKVTQISLRKKFNVHTYSSPAEALKHLGDIKPVIVLSDLKMPGTMTGVEFLELAQQIYPNAVRIIVTGNSDEESVIQAIKRAGLFDFLKKPFINNQLEEAMVLGLEQFKRQDEENQKRHSLNNPDLMAHPSWLHKIANQLREAFHDLPQYHVTDKQIESWSLLIHLAMSAEKRYYHNTQHLFDISGGASSFDRLAILFHDVVYAQVDKNTARGTLPQIVDIMKPLTIDAELKLKLPDPRTLPDPKEHSVLYAVFGKQPGDVLNTMNGMNYSAL